MHLILIAAGLFSFASANPPASVDAILKARATHLESFYQDLHRNPELSMQEVRTQAKVFEEFKRLGLENVEKLGGGVIGIFRNGSGPTTLVRSELDGLPVTEETGLPYKSQNVGVMHACGHDLHTTALVATAEVMMQQKNNWKGTLVFVAQPAEERVKGAKAMLDAGLLKKIPKIDQALAIHTKGVMPSGKVGFTSGPALASADSIDVIIRGIGAHGAAPEAGVDTILLASEFVTKMQTLIGREKAATDPALITVGSFHAGSKHNIIPPEAKLEVTVRTYDEKVRKKLLRRIEEIAKGIAKTAGAPEPTVKVVESTPPTVNELRLTERVRKAVTMAMGEKSIINAPAMMGSEDFGQFGIAAGAPSLFIWIGASKGSDLTISNHSPKFAPDYKVVMPAAVKALVAGLMDLHGSSPVNTASR